MKPRQLGVSAQELERLKWLTQALDSKFRIPGTPFRFGYDGLIGLIPGVGDVLTAVPVIYFLRVANRTGASRMLQARMLLNALLDMLFGSIPVFGDLFDFMFKAHKRNLKLLTEHLERTARD